MCVCACVRACVCVCVRACVCVCVCVPGHMLLLQPLSTKRKLDTPKAFVIFPSLFCFGLFLQRYCRQTLSLHVSCSFSLVTDTSSAARPTRTELTWFTLLPARNSLSQFTES